MGLKKKICRGKYKGGEGKFCKQCYITNATRMVKHLLKCSKCHHQVKKIFIEEEIKEKNEPKASSSSCQMEKVKM